MGLLDDVCKSASKIAGRAMETAGTAMKTAVNKSSDFAEISKLKMKITAEEKSIDDLYYEIGRIIYADCLADGIVPESVKDQCSTVYEHKARITELQGKIELIRGQSGQESEPEESEVDFNDEEEVVIREVSPVIDTPEESSQETMEEEEKQYGVLPDLDATTKKTE
ncbi:MAG: hypothetical protein Q4C00_03280 [Bacillota bacterium]|nr:hypothetical protein [Bacillota bacterium]